MRERGYVFMMGESEWKRQSDKDGGSQIKNEREREREREKVSICEREWERGWQREIK